MQVTVNISLTKDVLHITTKTSAIVFFREKEGCQEMLLWVQIRNLLFFVGKSSFHKRHTSKDYHFDFGHQKYLDFKQEALFKNSYNSFTLFPLDRDTFNIRDNISRDKT